MEGEVDALFQQRASNSVDVFRSVLLDKEIPDPSEFVLRRRYIHYDILELREKTPMADGSGNG